MVCKQPPCWSDNEDGAETPPPVRTVLLVAVLVALAGDTCVLESVLNCMGEMT